MARAAAATMRSWEASLAAARALVLAVRMMRIIYVLAAACREGSRIGLNSTNLGHWVAQRICHTLP
jgi:hypothetical protein